MKALLYLIVICVAGFFLWQYSTKPSQRGTSTPAALPQPAPLPTGKAVSDTYKSLIVGGTTYSDVTVRMVYPDSLSIIHSDGAITIPLADAPKEIQTRYNYDPVYAAEYASLKASHAQYKADIATQAGREQAKEAPGIIEPTGSPQPSLSDQAAGLIALIAPTPTPPPPSATPPPTAKEQIEAMISKLPVDSTRLATLCTQFPSESNDLLKGKQITVSGQIKQLWVRGIDAADMDIDLVGTPTKDVVFSTDYSRYNTLHTGKQSYGYKLVKSGTRLMMYVTVEKRRGKGTFTTLDRVVHTEGEIVTLEGLIERTGPGDIKIHYAKGVVD
ncbi:MAG: hypothetical protein ACOYOL_00515 [Chthoniobacterales bacterium]